MTDLLVHVNGIVSRSVVFEDTNVRLRAVARGVLGGWLTPPTFVELTYSENRVGHSENYGNNSITKF
jgi:hypothetical protein